MIIFKNFKEKKKKKQEDKLLRALQERSRNYFQCKDETFYTAKTKRELCATINVFDPATVLPWCKEFNIPFIEEQWLGWVKRYYERYIHSQTAAEFVFSRYLCIMKLKSWENWTFKDSDDVDTVLKYEFVIAPVTKSLKEEECEYNNRFLPPKNRIEDCRKCIRYNRCKEEKDNAGA